MTVARIRYLVLVIFLFSTLVSNARHRNRILEESVSLVNANDTTKSSAQGLGPDYSKALENALKRNDELTNRKKTLNDSIKYWTKELKRLGEMHESLVKSNEKLVEKISQAKVKEQRSGISELRQKKEQLLKTIETEEKEKALLESQLQEISSKLDKKNTQRGNLGKIKENVSNQIITENRDYLENPFSEMNLGELTSIRSKCQKYATDAKVNAFVAKLDIVINNKKLYDNISRVVNSAYKKYDIDRALASATQIKNANTVQIKEINELKTQLTLFPDGLAAFKEYITKLNVVRNGVNYSMEYFQTDNEQILSKNDIRNRIENKLKKVPYLNKKFEEFMAALKKAPNKHSDVETEILNQ